MQSHVYEVKTRNRKYFQLFRVCAESIAEAFQLAEQAANHEILLQEEAQEALTRGQKVPGRYQSVYVAEHPEDVLSAGAVRFVEAGEVEERISYVL